MIAWQFQIYLDDALNERLWVDQAECRPFVLAVLTAAFGGRQLPPEGPRVLNNVMAGEGLPAPGDYSLCGIFSGLYIVRVGLEESDLRIKAGLH